MKSSNPVVQRALDARTERLAREVVTNMTRRRPVTDPIVANALRQYGILVENGEYEVPESVIKAVNAPKFGTQAYEEWGKRNGLTKDKTGHYHKEMEQGGEGGGKAEGAEQKAKTTEELAEIKPGDDPKTVKMKEKLAAEHAKKLEAQKGLEAAKEKRDEAKAGRDAAVEETARKGLTADENRTLDGILAGAKSAGQTGGLKEAAERIAAGREEFEKFPDDHPQKELAMRQVEAAEKYLGGVKKAEDTLNVEKHEYGKQIVEELRDTWEKSGGSEMFGGQSLESFVDENLKEAAADGYKASPRDGGWIQQRIEARAKAGDMKAAPFYHKAPEQAKKEDGGGEGGGADDNIASDGKPKMKDGKVVFDRSDSKPKPYANGETDFSEQAILNHGVSKEEFDAMSKVAKTEMVVGRDADGNPIKKPVSPEFHGMVTAMLCGVDVPDETIKNTPEWKEMQAKADAIEAEVVSRGGVRRIGNKSVVDTNQINTRERERMRRDLKEKFLSDTMDETNCEAVELARDENGKKIPGKYKVVKDENGNEVEMSPYKVKRGRELHMITGLPSAGKSSVFANGLCRKLGARLTDCDAIKQKLPEFNNGLGANAVHEESSTMNDEIIQMAYENGDNIVYPMLGKNAEKIERIKAEAEAHGYTVHLHYNDLSPEKAKGRLVNRMMSQGRFMDTSLVSRPGYACRKAFEDVRDKFDYVEAASNDVGVGKKPIMLFRRP